MGHLVSLAGRKDVEIIFWGLPHDSNVPQFRIRHLESTRLMIKEGASPGWGLGTHRPAQHSPQCGTQGSVWLLPLVIPW